MNAHDGRADRFASLFCDMPNATARIMEDFMTNGGSDGFCGTRSYLDPLPERATAMIRALYMVSVDRLIAFNLWIGSDEASARRERDNLNSASALVNHIFRVEIKQAPTLLVLRFAEQKTLDLLFKRSKGAIPPGTHVDLKGKTRDLKADELEEELSTWLVVRSLYCAAIIRSVPSDQIASERLKHRINFVHELESHIKVINECLCCSSEKELWMGRAERAKDMAKIWITIEEEIRSIIEQDADDTDVHLSQRELLPVRLLGTERRTQVVLDQEPKQLEKRPFVLPLNSKRQALNLLLTTLRVHLPSIHYSTHFIPTITPAIEATISLWHYVMQGYPSIRDEAMAIDLLEMIGMFFSDSQMTLEVDSGESGPLRPSNLATYVDELSPIGLDRLSCTVLQQIGPLCIQASASYTPDNQTSLQKLPKLLLDTLRWLQFRRLGTPKTQCERTIAQTVIRHGELLVKLATGPASLLNDTRASVQKICFATLLLSINPTLAPLADCPIKPHTLPSYKLLPSSLILSFESSVAFTNRSSPASTTSRSGLAKKRKRVGSEEGDVDVEGQLTRMDVDVMLPETVCEESQPNLDTPYEQMCRRIMQLIQGSEALPTRMDRPAIGAFLVQRTDDLIKQVLHLPICDDSASDKSLFCKIEKELDLLSTLICVSSLAFDESVETVQDGPYDVTDFLCSLCDRDYIDLDSLRASGKGNFGPEVFMSVVKFCQESAIFDFEAHLPAVKAKSKRCGQLQSQRKSALIRFVTTLLLHTDFHVSHDVDDCLVFLSHSSELGSGVMLSLQSGLRMERIAAGRLIVITLLKSMMIDGQMRAHLPTSFDATALFLKVEEMISLNHTRIQETLIVTLVWAFDLTRTLESELLDNGTIHLSRSLSHRLCDMITRQMCKPSAYLRGVLSNELAALARLNSTSVYRLLNRYIPSISQTIIVDLNMNTNGLTILVELLGMEVDVFLAQTAIHTVPRLVSSASATTLERFANCIREPLFDVLLDEALMVKVLTRLCLLPDRRLTQQGIKDLVNIMTNGGKCGQTDDTYDFSTRNLADYCGSSLYFNVIVEIGDETADVVCRDPKWALSNVYRLAKPDPDFSVTTEDRELEAELRMHMLPILTSINGSLQDLRGKYSIGDKVKVMRGFGTLIEIVNSGVNGFLPQIVTTLQASLSIPALRGPTLKVWHLFLNISSLKDLQPFIGQISAALVSVWSELTPDQLSLTVKMLHQILTRSKELGDYVHDIADVSLLEIPTFKASQARIMTVDGHQLFRDTQKHFSQVKKSISYLDKLHRIVDRINDESEIVVAQSLKELKHSLHMETDQIRLLTSGDSFDPVIGSLLKALTGVSTRFNEIPDELRSLTFECLGVVGALDPDRFEISDDSPGSNASYNFADHAESVEFAIHLIQDELAGAYTSASDTKHQHLLAFAIQELLQFCGFTPELAGSSSKKHVSPDIRKRWKLFPKDIHQVISPLLSAKYRLDLSNLRKPDAPVYLQTSVYNSWLQNWYLRLIPLIKTPDAEKVFSPLLGAVRNGATMLAQNILPHLVLHMLIAEDIGEVQNIKLEIITILEDQVNRQSAYSPEGRQLVAETIFGLIDHCTRWLRDRGHKRGTIGSSTKKTDLGSKTDLAAARMKSFISEISPELMATAALSCKDHARALLNFEQRIWMMEDTSRPTIDDQAPNQPQDSSTEEDLRRYYESVHQIYSEIDEPDGMEGISTKIPSPSILHQIREHESTGRWTSAQSCWEVELQRQPDELRSHVGLLRCLKNLGHYDSLRTHIIGVLQTHPAWERDLAPFTVESSLVSNDWQGLTRAVQIGSPDSPEIIFGKVIETMLTCDEETINKTMDDARIRLGNQLLGSSRKDVYRRVYDSVVYLHILHEVPLIDSVCKMIHSPNAILPTQDRLFSGGSLMRTLESRIDAISPAFRHREQVLRLRRAAFQLRYRGSPAVGQLWVQTANIARKAGHLQTSYSAVLQASELNAPTAFLQKAKLLKQEDQPHKAIAELEANLPHCTPKDASIGNLSDISTRDYGKASLQRVRWMHEVDRYSVNVIVSNFDKIAGQYREWSSPHYYFGRFYDEKATALHKQEKAAELLKPSRADAASINAVAPDYIYHCCRNFVRSLTFGTKFIYQALPRMLTLYFSMGEHKEIVRVLHAVDKERRTSEIRHEDYTRALNNNNLGSAFLKIDKVMHSAVRKLPVFEWLTVLPQVVSRVMHKSTHVQALVHKILTHVLRSYPDQALWAMVSGVESSNSARSSRCTWVLNDAKEYPSSVNATATPPQLSSEDLARKFDQCRKLVRQLLHLCNYPVRDSKKLSLNEHFPALQKCAPCELIVPLQSSLIASLPPHDINFASHIPFPAHLPTIAGFADEVTIMASLQKPRRICIRGSDGKDYPFLCKPKDDLRKDARLMEFNSMINKLLKKHSESRKRNLHIRTYAVVVLNEECGLLEWVPNTIAFRSILTNLYAARNIPIWTQQVKLAGDRLKTFKCGEKKVKWFETELLAKYPPIFHQWFLMNFPDPGSWLRSRLAYGRTAAVISMVGFVLGLGDRHGENILFDSTTGDTVHVDFNCLFDKARTFEVAEKVPFRLTQNLVAGLGVSGVEGVFRKACEVTMMILRNNKESLMSVLETFVHDPLVDWMPTGSKKKLDSNAEQLVAREAKRALDPIDRKLTGHQITSAPSGKTERATSTENQVDSLINEARDPLHLAGMYIGWAPYL